MSAREWVDKIKRERDAARGSKRESKLAEKVAEKLRAVGLGLDGQPIAQTGATPEAAAPAVVAPSASGVPVGRLVQQRPAEVPAAKATAPTVAKARAKRTSGFSANARPEPDAEATPFSDWRLETLLTHRDAFGIEQATPLQRAACRASDGLPIGDLWYDADVREGFGGEQPPTEIPLLFMIIAGIRGAKSTLAAAKAIQLTQTCDLSGVMPGDEVRIPVLATEKDQAHAVFSLVCACLLGPAFQHIAMGPPKYDSIMVRHPTGHPVEIKVVALARHATTVVARWLPGCVLDEAPRMVGLEDGVKNLDSTIDSIMGRIRPGGQVFLIGSPYAPFGPVYKKVRAHFGKPTRDAVVVRGRGPQLNPTWWTPERCERLRVANPRAYRTDVLAEFADLDDALISIESVERAPEPTAPEKRERWQYTAAIEPASWNATWTLVVIGCSGSVSGRSRFEVVAAKQWTPAPGASVSPEIVLQEVAAIVAPLGCAGLLADQYVSDKLLALAAQAGLSVAAQTLSPERRFEMIDGARYEFVDGTIAIPRDEDFRSDLLAAQRKISGTSVSIEIQNGMGGYLRALALALAYPPGVPRAKAEQADEWDHATSAAVRAQSPAGQWDALIERLGGGDGWPL